MIYIQEAETRKIKKEGEKAYPDECCGALLGILNPHEVYDVKEILPIRNTGADSERYHRFEIQPDDVMCVECEARKRGLDVIGYYHSHPDHPARPSEYDREHALPFYLYLIVAVQKGAAVEMTGWRLKEDRTVYIREKPDIL
jgi:proteasome lid subunit RPN8/RPN11